MGPVLHSLLLLGEGPCLPVRPEGWETRAAQRVSGSGCRYSSVFSGPELNTMWITREEFWQWERFACRHTCTLTWETPHPWSMGARAASCLCFCLPAGHETRSAISWHDWCHWIHSVITPLYRLSETHGTSGLIVCTFMSGVSKWLGSEWLLLIPNSVHRSWNGISLSVYLRMDADRCIIFMSNFPPQA